MRNSNSYSFKIQPKRHVHLHGTLFPWNCIGLLLYSSLQHYDQCVKGNNRYSKKDMLNTHYNFSRWILYWPTRWVMHNVWERALSTFCLSYTPWKRTSAFWISSLLIFSTACPWADIKQSFPSKAKSISRFNWLDSWWDSRVARALKRREHDGHSGANSVPVKWLNALSSLPRPSERPVHIQGIISRLVWVMDFLFAGDPSCQSSASTLPNHACRYYSIVTRLKLWIIPFCWIICIKPQNKCRGVWRVCENVQKTSGKPYGVWRTVQLHANSTFTYISTILWYLLWP